MTLRVYRNPPEDASRASFVRIVSTDDHGRFDFGVLQNGHYQLDLIDTANEIEASFDVEIATLSKRVDSVLIDVSPPYADCSGGLEFLPIDR